MVKVFWFASKNAEEAYGKINGISNTNDYTTGNYWILLISKHITN